MDKCVICGKELENCGDMYCKDCWKEAYEVLDEVMEGGRKVDGCV